MEELNDSRCVECNRLMYWDENKGAVHYNGDKRCPSSNIHKKKGSQKK